MKKKVDILNIVKVGIILCLCVFFFLEIHQPSDSKTPFNDVYAASIKDVDISTMQENDKQQMKRFLAISPDQYKNIVYLKDTDSMCANEIVIVEFNENSQANAFKEAMLARMKVQKNIFDGYIQEQADLVNKGTIFTQANYGIYIVHAQNSVILTQFKGAL